MLTGHVVVEGAVAVRLVVHLHLKRAKVVAGYLAEAGNAVSFLLERLHEAVHLPRPVAGEERDDVDEVGAEVGQESAACVQA